MATNPIGAVPQAQQQQQQAASGVDLVSALLQQKNTINAEISKTLPAALSPTKQQGVSSPHLPGSFEFGVGQPNLPPAQGHRDARNQGVAKTIAGVANIVGQIKKAEDSKQQREFSSKIEKVLAAQDAVSQAGQVPKDSPGYADAQALIKKNQQIINDTISADPKTKKKFEKAFDINFVDPSQNDQPEHKALQQASKSYAEQLAAKTPDKLVPNQAAQNKLQVLSQQAAALDATTKAVLPLATQEMRDQNAMNRTIATQEGANQRANQRDATTRDVAAANIQQRTAAVNEHWKATMANVGSANSREIMREQAAFNRTMATVQGRQRLAETKGLKGDALDKVEEQNAGLIQKQLDTLPDLINKTETIRKNADKSQKDHYDKVIQGYEKEMSTYQQMLDDYHSKHTGKGVLTNHGNSSTTSNTKTAPATNVVGQEDDDSDDTNKDLTDPDSDFYK